MGNTIVDGYLTLHILSGAIAYAMNIPFVVWFIIHLVFEIFENTKQGVKFINTYIRTWSGGKRSPDVLSNTTIDQIAASFGWFFAWYLDKIN